MSDVDWDAEEYDPENFSTAVGVAVGPAVGGDKWDGEDEDDVKDAWDVSDDESKDGASATTVEGQKKKKKNIKDIIAQKEAKKREELDEKRKAEEEAKRKLTPEEMLAEKLRQQKLQEESDLELVKESLGVSNDELAGRVGFLDTFEPITKEDFDQYSTSLQERFTKFERSTHYITFLESLFREITVSLEVDDVKRLSSCLNAVYNEKNKAQKVAKGKKKGKSKMSLNPGKDDNYEDYTVGAEDDYGDFM